MIKLCVFVFAFLMSCQSFVLAQQTAHPAKQEISDTGKDLRKEFLAAGRHSGKSRNWSGKWTRPFRFSRANLKITNISATKFRFAIDSLTGANMGKISGVAQIKGSKGFFDDAQTNARSADKYNCKLLFIHSGNSIEIEQAQECSSYGGAGVSFDGKYSKGEPVLIPQNFVEAEVFPNINFDRKFKTLVGREYERFLNSFHLVNEENDLDNLKAKVFAACVRGVCPYVAGVIMFDAQEERIWAAVLYDDEKSLSVHYYTSETEWADKLPETIKKWKDGLDPKMPVVFKSEQKQKGVSQ